MEYKRRNAIVCIKDTKDASLYFDEILPIELNELIPIKGSNEPELLEVLRSILPSSLIDQKKARGVHPDIINYLSLYLVSFPSSLGIINLPNNEILDQRAKKYIPQLISSIDDLIKESGLRVESIFGLNDYTNIDVQDEDPAFIINGLKLVDTSNISWTQILEIRNDKESLKKLRKLRLFIYENYHDKPITYIEDDLHERIEMYEKTAKELGLKTRESVLNTIFSSESAVGLTIATLASVILATPIAISMSAAIGSTFLLGNIAIEFKSHRRDLLSFKKNNPITYLIDIKNIEKNN